jgi:parallel beta-helix repeat protein
LNRLLTLVFCCSITAFLAQAATPVNCGDNLNQPGGQYVLTGNLVCPFAPAVLITANNVQFDLQGFTLSRTGAPLGAGITTAEGNSCVATSGVHIHDGTITGFGVAVSICVPTPPGPVNTFAQIDNLHLTGNSSGIEVFNGNGNSIHNNTITLNLDTTGVSPGTAIYLANSSENLIAQNTLNSNAANGLELAGSKFNLIFGNTANTNRKSGVRLDAVSTDNVLYRNFAHGNAAFDLEDDNPNCGTNAWFANVAGTKNVSCIH